MLEIARVLPPVLLSVTVCAVPVVPTVWLAKTSEAGSNDTWGTLPTTPLPARLTVKGPTVLRELLLIVKEPVIAPD